MQGVFFAKLTEFIKLQSFFKNLFVLFGKIIGVLTFLALHFYQVVLRHIFLGFSL